MSRINRVQRNSKGQLYGLFGLKGRALFGRNYWGDWVLWLGADCFTLHDAGPWT